MAAEELRGQVVVITGASSGFGKGAARRVADRQFLQQRSGTLVNIASALGKHRDPIAVGTEVSAGRRHVR